MRLYNTASREVEEIKPISQDGATVYTCGPTVYDYPHIGNWFTFIRYDLLIRTLKNAELNPKWVMNITDVGHLVSDADEGEDKLEKGARREGKTAWDVAKYYGDYFLEALDRVNMLKPDYLPRATELIIEQINLVKTLEEKGYTYIIDDGVYFDTSKLDDYGKLARLDKEHLKEGARVEVNRQKKNPTDFAVWKFSPAGEKRDMEWWSPWQPPNSYSEDEKHTVGEPRTLHEDAIQGESEQQTEAYETYAEGAAEDSTPKRTSSLGKTGGFAASSSEAVQGSWGFPGWHLECSVMAMKYLGDRIDIHAGGIDHIPVHHTNEIAQSEAATGQTFSKYWMHANFILVDGKKMSKSMNNFYTLEDIQKQGFDLEAFRLLVLESHYRTEANFSWKTLEAAQNRLEDFRAMADMRWQPYAVESKSDRYATQNKIQSALEADLNTPGALALLSLITQEIIDNSVHKDELEHLNKFLEYIDSALGLRLANRPDVNKEQKKLLADRQDARSKQAWEKSDQIRDELAAQGIKVRDTSLGQIWERKTA